MPSNNEPRLDERSRRLSLRIVLVQPRNPLNILAAARAARNFGLGDIVVAEVHPPAWAEALEKDVDRETPHGPRATSRGWLGDARKCETLLEAIADCDWVLGTSSLERRKVPAAEVIDLRELPVRLAEACGWTATARTTAPAGDGPHSGATRRNVAILFGSEKRGLTNEHLMRCHHLLHIPTVESKPSMNLGQAVAVVCYELARSGVAKRILAGRGREFVKADAEDSKEWVTSGDSAGSGTASSSGDAVVAVTSKVSKLTENKKLSGSSGDAANAAEIQALVEQVTALVNVRSDSKGEAEPAGEFDTRHRNLVKMITRLPLTGEDVRRILGVIKDAKNAFAASGVRPKKPQKPKKP